MEENKFFQEQQKKLDLPALVLGIVALLISPFSPLTFEEMLEIDGWRNWVSTVAGGAGIVGGASTIVWAGHK